MKGPITDSCRKAIGILAASREADIQGHSAYPYLVLPALEWVMAGNASAESIHVYLRGCSLLLSGFVGEAGVARGVRVISGLESLLRRVSAATWEEVGKAAIDWYDPALRNLQFLVPQMLGYFPAVLPLRKNASGQ